MKFSCMRRCVGFRRFVYFFLKTSHIVDSGRFISHRNHFHSMSGPKMNLDDILDQALEDFEKEFTKPSSVPKKAVVNTSTIKNSLSTSSTKVSTVNQGSTSSSPISSVDVLKDGKEATNVKLPASVASGKLIDDMISQFEESDEKDDEGFDEVIDGMMQQLLSKDLMCEPTRLLCERYPIWLSENKDKISEEQYASYEKQYATFQRLLATYDTQPDNYTRYV